MQGTPAGWISQIAAGTHVFVRDEQWIVQRTQHTPTDGVLVRCMDRSRLAARLDECVGTVGPPRPVA